jgi:hypothetical protein
MLLGLGGNLKYRFNIANDNMTVLLILFLVKTKSFSSTFFASSFLIEKYRLLVHALHTKKLNIIIIED